jgi:hypothetical protein
MLIPSRDNTAAPARPATTTARSAISAVSCRVRRAPRGAMVGTCSRKVRCTHSPVWQSRRRTRSSTTTARPAAGRSARRRTWLRLPRTCDRRVLPPAGRLGADHPPAYRPAARSPRDAVWARNDRLDGLVHHSGAGSQGGFNQSSQYWVVGAIVGVGRGLRRESSSRAFPGSAVERVGDGIDLFGTPSGQVGAFRKVLPQQAVGVFSLVPRCRGLCGSAKNTGTPVSTVNRACADNSLPRSQVSNLRS